MIPAPTAQKAVRQVLNPSADTSNHNETDVAATDFVIQRLCQDLGPQTSLGEIESSGIRASPMIQLVKIGLSENRCSRHLER